MVTFRQWKSGAAMAIAVGMTANGLVPLMAISAMAAPAPQTVAQSFPTQNPQFPSRIPAGAVIPASYTQAQRIVVLPTETVSLTLNVPRNIRSSSGRLLIPAGSRIEGKLQPAKTTSQSGSSSTTVNGSQFVAETLILPSGRRVRFDASSDVITKTERVDRGTNTDAIIKGAAVGAGAATLISGLAGNRRITIPKVLGGAAAGALGGLLLGGRRTAEVIVIESNTDLNLTLNSPLTIDWS